MQPHRNLEEGIEQHNILGYLLLQARSDNRQHPQLVLHLLRLHRQRLFRIHLHLRLLLSLRQLRLLRRMLPRLKLIHGHNLDGDRHSKVQRLRFNNNSEGQVHSSRRNEISVIRRCQSSWYLLMAMCTITSHGQIGSRIIATKSIRIICLYLTWWKLRSCRFNSRTARLWD